MLKNLIVSLALVIPLFAMAEEKQPEFEISCQDGPKEMVTEVPNLVQALASVKCTIYGQILTGADGVLWNYLGGFAPVIIPAQMVRAQPEKVTMNFTLLLLKQRN